MFCSIWIKHRFWERRKGSSFGNVGEWKSRAETEGRNSDSSLLTNRDGEQKDVSTECWFILDSDILLSAILKNPLTPGLSMQWRQSKDRLCSDISPRIIYAATSAQGLSMQWRQPKDVYTVTSAQGSSVWQWEVRESGQAAFWILEQLWRTVEEVWGTS